MLSPPALPCALRSFTDERAVSNARLRATVKDERRMLIRLRRGIKIQPRARTGPALVNGLVRAQLCNVRSSVDHASVERATIGGKELSMLAGRFKWKDAVG